MYLLINNRLLLIILKLLLINFIILITIEFPNVVFDLQTSSKDFLPTST